MSKQLERTSFISRVILTSKGGHLMKNHHNVLNPLSEEPGIILQLHRHHFHGGVVELGFIDHRESSRELAGRKSRSI